MRCVWREGNRITLLENGDNYYPAVFDAISARGRVILETTWWNRRG
jgi:cardiolipin synthase